MTKDCRHEHGDMVNGYWLCGQCYTKMAERPSRLVMEPIINVSEGETSRQIAVHAEIRTAESGLTLSEFIRLMAMRLITRNAGAMHMSDAIDYAAEVLKMAGDEFGSPDLGWDTACAWDLVDEDMSYWDGDGDGRNG